MDPLQQQINNLTERVSQLEKVENIDNIKLWKEIVLGRKVGADDPAITTQISVTIGAGGGTSIEDVVDYPDGFLRVKLQDGTLAYLPYYNGARF